MGEHLDDEGVTHESYRSYLTSLAGLCGCRDEALVDDLVTILQTYQDEGVVYFTRLPIEGPPKYKELFLHLLTEAGLIEHGTAVRGSWLTDEGKDAARRLAIESEESP